MNWVFFLPVRLGENFVPNLEKFALSPALDSLTVLVDAFGANFTSPTNFWNPRDFPVDPEPFMLLGASVNCGTRPVCPLWAPAQVPPIRIWHLHKCLPLLHTPSKTAMDACTGVCVISRCLCRRRHLEKRAAQPAHNPAGASKVACWAPNNQAAQTSVQAQLAAG